MTEILVFLSSLCNINPSIVNRIMIKISILGVNDVRILLLHMK